MGHNDCHGAESHLPLAEKTPMITPHDPTEIIKITEFGTSCG